VYGILLLSIISLQVLSKNKNNSLDQKIEQTSSLIKSYQSREAKYLLLTDKVNALTELLPGREKKQKIIDSFLELITEETKLTNLDLGKQGQVNYSAQFETLKEFEEFLDNMKAKAGISQLPILEAKVANVTYGPEIGYSLDAYIIFAEK
jgi:hypothetical protein